LHLGIFEPAQVGNFQSAKTGEFSTGTDNAQLREIQAHVHARRAPLEALTKAASDTPPDAQQALILARLEAIEATQAHQEARLQALENQAEK
jgi:hypothetical protein